MVEKVDESQFIWFTGSNLKENIKMIVTFYKKKCKCIGHVYVGLIGNPPENPLHFSFFKMIHQEKTIFI